MVIVHNGNKSVKTIQEKGSSVKKSKRHGLYNTKSKVVTRYYLVKQYLFLYFYKNNNVIVNYYGNESRGERRTGITAE